MNLNVIQKQIYIYIRFILQFASIRYFLCWLHPPIVESQHPSAPGLDAADIRGEVFLTSDVFTLW